MIEVLAEWGGELVEVAYTEGISSTALNQSLREIGITPAIRMQRFRRLLEVRPLVRLMEAHSGLTGLIVERTSVQTDHGPREFDGMWLSSLTDSTAKGKPDIEAVDLTSRVQTVSEIVEVTTKPIVYDGDTGGKPEHFVFTVKTLERLGVSAVIIEDKLGLKKNSLFGTDAAQVQDSIESFSHRIATGKKAQVTDEFMIIARIESLILGAGMDDALEPAEAYIAAGADGIMIHSSQTEPGRDPRVLRPVQRAAEAAAAGRRADDVQRDLRARARGGRRQRGDLRQPAAPRSLPGDGPDGRVDPDARPLARGRRGADADQGDPAPHPWRLVIEPAAFHDALQRNGLSFFAGVPDSLLKDLCAYITDHVPADDHVITANEGAAVALAAGYHLATGQTAVVYLQNSGTGNAVNPLLSLADPAVYAIPMLLLIGWRGEPGVTDEPQHVTQGRIQERLLEAIEVPTR